MSNSREVPAQVRARLERRRSGAAGIHGDRRTRRQRTRSAKKRAAMAGVVTVSDSPFYVAFDLETTGLNVTHDNIVTAAVVGVPHDMNILLSPLVPVSQEAYEVHGISTEHARENGMDYAEGLTLLGDTLRRAWDAGATIVGHNISGMDLPMLRMQERMVFGSPRTKIGPFLDTFRAYKKAFPGQPKHRLVDACEHLGIELGNAHDAKADAQASLTLAYKLWKISQEKEAANV